jgi:ABC-type amino acid transport system permease subunit
VFGEVSRVRIFRTTPALFVLLVVTFGLFLGSTLGHHSPAPDPVTGTTLTVFTDLSAPPDAPALAMGGPLLGAVMIAMAILCGLLALASVAVAVLALSRCRDLMPDRA